MRKLLIAGMAVAMLAIPAAASADVPRCEASVPVSTTVTTATFTMNQPRDTSASDERLEARFHRHRLR